jgi:tetratricopeptide (TPR) repeat protein
MEEYDQALIWADRFIANMPSGGVTAHGHVGKAFLHGWLGDSGQALRELEKAQDLARAAESKFWEDEVDRTRAWMYCYLGEPESGRSILEGWTCAQDEPSYPGPEGEVLSVAFYEAARELCLGIMDLKAGQVTSARSRLSDVESRVSEDGLRFLNWPPLFRDALNAEALLEEGSIERAIRIYENAQIPQVPNMWVRTMVPYNVLFPRDALARAYYRGGELDRAIAEYERLVTFDPESNDRRLVHPRYHYALAKLYEEKGWSAKAISEYQRFLTIWKEADEGLTEVVDANNRLAALAG